MPELHTSKPSLGLGTKVLFDGIELGNVISLSIKDGKIRISCFYIPDDPGQQAILDAAMQPGQIQHHSVLMRFSSGASICYGGKKVSGGVKIGPPYDDAITMDVACWEFVRCSRTSEERHA
ncbi:MAG TPA: hypothetical protein VKW06_00645 [Candidatus Angelobacter sp.]|nr:hypothetical protein [Candidatus Angelobacter sp.]